MASQNRDAGIDPVAFIIKNSPNEDEAVARLTKHAKDIHGPDTINELINVSSDPESFKEDIIRMARQPKEKQYQPFKQGENLLTQEDLSNTLKAYNSLLAKTGTVPISAVRSATKLSTEPFVTEVSSKVPTEEGSFRKDIGPVAGTITDIAVTGSLGAGLNKLAPILKGMSIDNAEKSLLESSPGLETQRELVDTKKYVPPELPVQKDGSIIEGIKTILKGENPTPTPGQKTDIRRIAETASEFNLIPYLTDKTKMLRKLSGDIYKGTKVTPGLIGEKSSELAQELSSVSGKQGMSLGEKDIIPKLADKARSELIKKMAPPESGIEFDQESVNKIDKIINRFFKPKEIPYGDSSISERAKSIISESMNPTADKLIKLKRMAQQYAYDSGKMALTDPKSAAEDKHIYDQIWKTIDEEIYNMANQAGPEHAPKIHQLNKDLSNLFHLENVVKDAPITGSASVMENLLGAGLTGGTAAALTGNPAYAVTGAAFPFARKLGSNMIGGLDSVIGSSQAGIANTLSSINPSTYAAAASSASLNAESQIDSMLIPMNTDEITRNRPIVSAKILKSFGPQAEQQFNSVTNPDQMRAFIRTLQVLNPQVFGQTKYNNIDGYIDPAFKQQAINDIVKDKGSPSQNALKMETLLHEGKIIGE